MYRGNRRPWRRAKGGFRCRLHSRLRILSLLEKMKKAYGRMMASLVSLGETFNSFARSKRRSYVCSSAPMRRPCYGESNSFYAEAIADCIEFIKLSSSKQADVR
ncbi:hypothetical protein SUGI_0419250 [Cryptomeria japonica]|nr:hypothetical protein SUGI_0419250 [Cryptomeria japonica]